MTDFEWEGKTVLLTGGNGFLGSHLKAKLSTLGCNLVAPSRLNTDLTKQEQVQELFESVGPEIVIHTAGTVGGIKDNSKFPATYFYDNLQMGMNMIHYANYVRGVSKFVQIGTVSSYPQGTPLPMLEENLHAGLPGETLMPYGIGKRTLLYMLQAYRKQVGLNGIYLIPTNLYGPGDTSSHVISEVSRKILVAKQNGDEIVTLGGTGKPTREFLYVDDCVDAIILATESYDSPDPVNISTGKDIPIHNLAHYIKQILGYPGEIEWDTSFPDGDSKRSIDTTKAEKAFKFKAKVSLFEGLKKTLA